MASTAVMTLALTTTLNFRMQVDAAGGKKNHGKGTTTDQRGTALNQPTKLYKAGYRKQ